MLKIAEILSGLTDCNMLICLNSSSHLPLSTEDEQKSKKIY